MKRSWVATYVNQVVPTEATAIDMNRRWWLTVLAGFLQAPGVTVYKSCDGTAVTANANSLTTLADFVWDTPGNPHSWIVLEFQNGMQVCFDFQDLGGGNGRDVDLTTSASGSFTGGTTTTAPAAVDQGGLPNFKLHNAPIAGTYLVNMMWTTDGSHVVLSAIGPADGIGGVGMHSLFVFTVDDVVSPAVTTVTRAVAGARSGWGAIDFMSCQGSLPDGSNNMHGEVTSMDDTIEENAAGNDYFDGRHGMWQFNYAAEFSQYNHLGYLRDIYGVVNDGFPTGEVYVTPAGERYANIGGYCVPWGAGPLQFDGTIAPVVNDVPAYLADYSGVPVVEIAVVSPAPSTPAGDPGGFSSDLATAQQTPIVIDIDSPSGIAYACVTCRFPNVVDELTVYAGDAFCGRFVGSSWEEALGTKRRLHVLPTGGWPESGELYDIKFDIDAVGGDGSNVATTRA